jgi:hypothetical protein
LNDLGATLRIEHLRSRIQKFRKCVAIGAVAADSIAIAAVRDIAADRAAFALNEMHSRCHRL